MWTLLVLVLVFQLPDRVGSCAATSETTTVATITSTTASSVTTTTVSSDTTTTLATDTTTPTTTTVTVATGCAGCTMDNPAIEYVMLNPGNVPIQTDEVGLNNAGCATRTITCNGLQPGSTVFIAWNDDNAGTTPGVDNANFVSGTLTCEADMQWHLTPGGPPIVTVECNST